MRSDPSTTPISLASKIDLRGKGCGLKATRPRPPLHACAIRPMMEEVSDCIDTCVGLLREERKVAPSSSRRVLALRQLAKTLTALQSQEHLLNAFQTARNGLFPLCLDRLLRAHISDAESRDLLEATARLLAVFLWSKCQPAAHGVVELLFPSSTTHAHVLHCTEARLEADHGELQQLSFIKLLQCVLEEGGLEGREGEGVFSHLLLS